MVLYINNAIKASAEASARGLYPIGLLVVTIKVTMPYKIIPPRNL